MRLRRWPALWARSSPKREPVDAERLGEDRVRRLRASPHHTHADSSTRIEVPLRLLFEETVLDPQIITDVAQRTRRVRVVADKCESRGGMSKRRRELEKLTFVCVMTVVHDHPDGEPRHRIFENVEGRSDDRFPVTTQSISHQPTRSRVDVYGDQLPRISSLCIAVKRSQKKD